MNCKKCGSPLTAEDQFCKNCGASVNEVNAQPMENNNGVSQNTSMPSSGMTNNMVNTPSMNQNNNGQQPAKSGSKNTLIFIIMGVIIVALIVCVVLLIPKKAETPNNGGGSNSGTGSNNNGGGAVVPASTSTYKVVYDGFTFNIPDNLVYEIANEELLLGDEDGTWVVEFVIGDGNFNQIKKNASQLQSNFQKNGFTAKPAEVKTIGGSEFVTIEIGNSGTNAVGAYAKLNSMKFAWVVAYNQDNDYDYDILKNIAPIISTATYDDTANGIEAQKKFNINMNEISKFAQ